MSGDPITFSVRGDPAPQPRPRPDRRSGKIYTPHSADAWKEAVRRAAGLHFMAVPWAGPVGIVLDFFLARTPGAIPGDWYQGTRGDFDNLAKAVCDSINPTLAVKERGSGRVIVPRGPGIWGDDRQIACALVRLRFAEAGCDPGVVAAVRRLGPFQEISDER